MNSRLLALLAVGHLTTDIYQGSVPALLPFLKDAYRLSYTQTATIVLVMQVASSIVQPLFGYLADRAQRTWLMPAGVGIAALGITMMGVVPSYGACLLLVTVGSLGVAAFHPQAYKSTHLVSADRPATGMAIFAVGGNIGHAIGPIFITSIILAFGLRSAYLGMLPGLVVAASLLWAIPPNMHRLIHGSTASGETPSGQTAGDALTTAGPPIPWGSLTLLMTIVAVRSWGQVALTTYIPLFYRDYLGEPPFVGSTVLLVYLGAGAAGTLVGGPVADRYGARMTLAVTMLISTPLMFAFPHLRGLPAMVVIALTGFLIVSTFALTIVIAQALLPTRGGVAAGLVFGFAVGAGGLGVAMLGSVADAWGLFVAMRVLAAVPVLAVPFVWALPADTPGARSALEKGEACRSSGGTA